MKEYYTKDKDGTITECTWEELIEKAKAFGYEDDVLSTSESARILRKNGFKVGYTKELSNITK